jgi:hypothetical protein
MRQKVIYDSGKRGFLVYSFVNGGARIEPEQGGPWDWAPKDKWIFKDWF